MSSAGSSNVGNMPPRHGKKLAEVMDEAFKANGKRADDSDPSKPEGSTAPKEAPVVPRTGDSVSAPAVKAVPPRKIEGYTAQFQVTAVYPPQPCERCIRSKKTCKGVAGARCEHCKSLHQKCSNSTGPPRGRHAGTSPTAHTSVHGADNVPLTAVTAGQQLSTNANADVSTAGSSAEPTRVKRKVPTKGKANEATREDGDEAEDPGARKKRRVGNDFQTAALKEVADLETAIKKMQSSVTKDLAKLSQLASTLATRIKGMDN